MLWIGSYGSADLTSYDPATGAFNRFGRMDDVDMYNYPLVGTEGTIACMIRMTRPHVVVFDPTSGRRQTVGPQIVQGEGSIDLQRRADGQLYIESSEGLFRLEGSQAQAVEALPEPLPAPTLA